MRPFIQYPRNHFLGVCILNPGIAALIASVHLPAHAVLLQAVDQLAAAAGEDSIFRKVSKRYRKLGPALLGKASMLDSK